MAMIVRMAGGELEALDAGVRVPAVKRSVYDRVEGVRGMAISLMAIGSLVQAIHSVAGSVAPVGR